MTQYNFHKFFTFYFIIFGIFISSFGAYISYRMEIDAIEQRIDTKAKEIYDIKIRSILQKEIINMDHILESLAKNEVTKQFLRANDPLKKQELEQIFLAVVGSQNKIMQGRILDATGREIIRIDSTKDNKSFVVSSNKLQDKSDRDYFKIVSKMSVGSIWHSKIDLNIENGKIEVPYKPTFRIATPLYIEQKFVGIVIVNLYIQDLLDAVQKSSAFDHYIIDKDHNFIIHPNHQYSFNKYKKIQRSLKDDFPNGLEEKGIYQFSIDDVLHNDDKAILVLKTQDYYQSTLINEKINTVMVVLILTIILSILMAIYISKKPAQLQKALLKAHTKLQDFSKIIDRYIITATTKQDSTIVEVSSAFEVASGYNKEELIGQKMHIVRDPNSDKEIFKELWKTILDGKIWHGEISNRKKNGEIYWLEQQIIPRFNEKNEIKSFVSVGVDITAKKELEKIASIDKLTNLYNRRMVDEFITKEVELEKREQRGLCVIMIDIDHFKNVNDTFGHQIGDEVLAQVARLLLENTRKSDIQGRYGGEEFIIICPQISLEDSYKLAEKIRNEVSLYHFNQVGSKTISLGLALYEEGDTPLSLIKKADLALYNAKGTGRNKTVSYNEIA